MNRIVVRKGELLQDALKRSLEPPDELIEGLITDALDILHHDRDDDGPIADHERASLRRRFKARLSRKSRPDKTGSDA